MSISEEDLIEGNYYLNPNHGLGRYVRMDYIQDKKYHVFQYHKNETLFVPAELVTSLVSCDKDFAEKRGLSRLGNNAAGAKVLQEYEAFTKTKLCLGQIEAFQNMLLHGLANSHTLLQQSKSRRHGLSSLSEYIESILNSSDYPDGYIKNVEVEIETHTNSAIVNFRVPNTSELPNTIGFKIDRTWGNLKEYKMKDTDFTAFYESVVFQIALRTIYEVFQATERGEVDSVVFNGWVDAVNRKTGNNFVACILSVMVSREQFEAFNLERVSPKECILYLKGIFAGRLHELAPVKPILEMDRSDKRFIEDVEILNELHEGVNLAEMDWDDFEYLVRELFEKMFSQDGAEVRVTRASRDGGVDAVAFDNDPIRGGKFIIQAKRYNNVVPVSAVRDLYGTVINEGAIKGLLVTTSYFGNDSREFAKDKPITLMDGSNLVYLLNEYGYKSHIKLRDKL